MVIDETLAATLVGWGFKFISLNGKIPVDKNWTKLGEADVSVLSISLKNWGVNCGLSNLVVLDIDVKNGKNGRHELEQLEAKHGKLPDTLTIGTINNGLHYYFIGKMKTSAGILGEGIDTRGTGGQVVSPLSPGYEIINFVKPATLPKWLEDLMEAKSQKVLTFEEGELVPDGERNDTLARVAGSLRGIGMTAEEMLPSLHAFNDNRCDPPLEDDEVETIAHSIARKPPEEVKRQAAKQRQKDQLNQDFDDYMEENSEDRPVCITTLTGTAPLREWAVGEWIPIGEVTSIYGSGGSGKSLLAYQLAYAAAFGGEWIGMPIATQMPVLCIFCEDDINETHRRANQVRQWAAVPETKDQLKVWDRTGRETALVREEQNGLELTPFFRHLENELAAMPEGNKLLVIDTLSDAYLANENNRQLVNLFIKSHLGKLRREYKATIILIAHPSRSGMGSGDMLSGTTAWENSVRCRLTFSAPSRDKKGKMVDPRHNGLPAEAMVLRRDKSNYAKVGEEAYVHWQEGTFKRLDFEVVTDSDPIECDVVDLSETGAAALLMMEDRETMAITDMYDTMLSEGYKKTSKTFKREILKDFERGISLDGCVYTVKKWDEPGHHAKYMSGQLVMVKMGRGTQPGHDSDMSMLSDLLS